MAAVVERRNRDAGLEQAPFDLPERLFRDDSTCNSSLVGDDDRQVPRPLQRGNSAGDTREELERIG